MSVNIPLQLNGTPIQELGTEFVKTQELDRDRGLINPIFRDEVDFNNYYTTEYISGVANQNVLYENNYNPTEELEFTDPQQRAKIAGSASLDRPLTVEEKQIELYTDSDLDPRLKQEIRTESQLSGSNLDFSQTQDFVREIQESVKAYNDEKNLYISLVPFTQSRESIARENMKNLINSNLEFPAEGLFDIFSGSYDVLQEQRTSAQKERLRTVERPLAPEGEPKRGQPVQEEKLKSSPSKPPPRPTPSATPRGPRPTPKRNRAKGEL